MPPRPVILPLKAEVHLPLAFISLGLGALMVATVWLALQPDIILLPHTHPSVLALTHLWLPGFLLSVCLGAFYQLMPVVLGVPLSFPAATRWLHFTLHAAGLPLLCVGFALGRFDWVGAGGLLLTLGLLCFAATGIRTFLASNRRDAIACSLPLAIFWLTLTASLGIVMAINRHHPFLPLGAIDLLRAHAHLGLAGFFLTLLQGMTFQLVPMFTMGTVRRYPLVWAGMLLNQAGLLILAPGLALGHRPAALLGATLMAGGVAASGIAFLATLRTRHRRQLETGLRAFTIGAGLLAASTVLGLALFSLPAGFIWIKLYGLGVIAGGLTLIVLGMILKIVPFLVWMHAYGPSVGKRPVPLTSTLSSPRLERLWLGGHLSALPLLALAMIMGSPAAATTGAWLLAAATLLFLINTTRVLGQLRQPVQTVPLAPTRPLL